MSTDSPTAESSRRIRDPLALGLRSALLLAVGLSAWMIWMERPASQDLLGRIEGGAPFICHVRHDGSGRVLVAPEDSAREVPVSAIDKLPLSRQAEAGLLVVGPRVTTQELADVHRRLAQHMSGIKTWYVAAE